MQADQLALQQEVRCIYKRCSASASGAAHLQAVQRI